MDNDIVSNPSFSKIVGMMNKYGDLRGIIHEDVIYVANSYHYVHVKICKEIVGESIDTSRFYIGKVKNYPEIIYIDDDTKDCFKNEKFSRIFNKRNVVERDLIKGNCYSYFYNKQFKSLGEFYEYYQNQTNQSVAA